MVESPSRLAATRAGWRAARLSAVFVIDVSRISRAGGDLLEPLLLTAILQANQAAVLADPELQLQYGDAETAAPDALRRPISVNALAQSLGLPFETVRRRVRRLELGGLCVGTAQGVYVPEPAVRSAAYLAVQAARVARLADLHRDLAAAGLPAGPPTLPVFLDGAVRAADRLLANYMLRICADLMALTGSALDGFVLLGLFAETLRDAEPASLSGGESLAALARPATGTQLAQALGLPGETVRRRLAGLAGAGFGRRGRRGWVATAPAAARPAIERLLEENAQNLRRLFAGLAELAARDTGSGRAVG